MGESLFYSWLRHVKECQVVQTNWKVSSQWNFNNTEEIEMLYAQLDTYFETNYAYKVFKKNSSLMQIIQQGECDALGISMRDGLPVYYAVDVAFHENGLNYGTKDETVMKVIAKCIRTAFCIYGFLESKKADIIFASPKINKSILDAVSPCVDYLNTYFAERGFSYKFRLICNEDFESAVLQPILLVSKEVADTSELFIRAYQMYAMFAGVKITDTTMQVKTRETRKSTQAENLFDQAAFAELKVGKIAQTVLRELLESGCADEEEVRRMQTEVYSKQVFDLNYPLLIAEEKPRERIRYYATPLTIRGKRYYLCSQWFEVPANNDRPYLLAWIRKHT